MQPLRLGDDAPADPRADEADDDGEAHQRQLNAERDRMFANINRAKLNWLELEILDNLATRPRRTWCVGCDTLLRAYFIKART